MAKQGWYPDPGGESGMFRYWDGSTWSEVLSSTPLPGPPNPSPGSAPVAPGTQPIMAGGSGYGYAPTPTVYGTQTTYPTQSKRSVGPWILLIVGVVAVGLIAYFIVKGVIGPVVNNPTDPIPTGVQPSTQVCPKQIVESSRAPHPDDDRVYGGKLSYPKLGDPWGSVATEEVRVPFGRDVAEQTILIHKNPNPKAKVGEWQAWVASVLVSELYAGDGFYSPREGSEIVNRCIFGAFYGDTEITADELRSERFDLDGHEGWITETNLHFSIPHLETTSELAIVIIVRTSDMSSSLFYASIPGDAMQYKPDVDRAIADLHVVT